ncbi:MAG: hypothetical protein HQ475_04435 [SAR202 cluster bacterium]|nr:hypothetical protein [SAR202 cluster bacterium]
MNPVVALCVKHLSRNIFNEPLPLTMNADTAPQDAFLPLSVVVYEP